MVVTMQSKKGLSGSWKNDRISELPDSLLHHILSFLNAMEVVRTSVLSKRWRYLWTSVPSLEFSDQMIKTNVEGCKLPFFTNFVNQFLLRRDFSPIDKFIIRSYLNVKAIAVESFISYAVKLGVQQLDIDCFFPTQEGPIELPPFSFSCDSITTLKLNFHEGLFVMPASLGLPSLKTLHLVDFGNFDGNVLSTCPNLETLILEGLYLYGIKSFNINAPNLKTLVLDIREIDHGDPKFSISAPKLTKFKFATAELAAFSVNNLNSLDEVDFDLMIFQFDLDETRLKYLETYRKICLDLVNMLKGFRNAKSITLSRDAIEILNVGPHKLSSTVAAKDCVWVLSLFPDILNEHPSQLSKLKHLTLEYSLNDHVIIPGCVFAYFIKSSPSLKVCLQHF